MVQLLLCFRVCNKFIVQGFNLRRGGIRSIDDHNLVFKRYRFSLFKFEIKLLLSFGIQFATQWIYTI